MDTLGRFNVVITNESTQNTATIQAVLSLNAWDFVAVKIEYETTDYKTSITGFSNGVIRDTIEYTDFTIVELQDSDGAIGARFDEQANAQIV